MAFLIATGRKFNLLERCAVAPTPTPAEDSRFAIAKASDGYPDQPFMFGSVAANADVLVDLNEVPNGDMETAFDVTSTLPTSTWAKVGNPTVTRVTGAGNFNGGAAGCRVVGTAGTDYIYFDAPFLAGEAGRFTVASRRGTNVGENANVYVQNLQNGNWLTSAGAWTSTKTAFMNSTSTTFATVSANFTVESFLLCGSRHAVTLRVILDGGGAAGSGPIYDDVYIWAAVGLASVHGHNLVAVPSTTLTLQSGTTNNPATSRATWTGGSAGMLPSFYASFAPVPSDRWWRFRYTPGANALIEPIWYGELVLAQTTTLLKEPNTPISHRFVMPQLRGVAERIAYARSAGPTRILGCSFRYSSLATFQQARDEIYRRSLGGVYASVVIPNDADPEVCIYGRLMAEWAYDLTLVTYFTGSTLVWSEMPLPTFLP